MTMPDGLAAQSAPEVVEDSSAKALKVVVAALLTGGLSLVFLLARRLPVILRTGWESRAIYTLAPVPKPSPWPWIGRAWLGLLALSVVLQVALFLVAAVLSLLLGRGSAGPLNQGQGLLLTARILAWPQLVLGLAVLGQGLILATHTVLHAARIPSVATHLARRWRVFRLGSTL